MANKVGRIVSWTIGIVILLIILLLLIMYIPWVQEKAKDIACTYVKEKTGMNLSVGKILIKFPLDISLDDVKLLDQNGDTMLVAKNFTANVALRPILDKEFKIDGAELNEGKYRLASKDSSMLLSADVRHCKFTGADIDLDNNKINVIDGTLTGGKVHLTMFPHKKINEQDTTQSNPWRIEAQHLSLNDVDYTMEMLPTIDKLSAHVDHADLKGGIVDTGAHTVDAKSLAVDGVDCKYIYPSQEWADRYSREHPLPPEIPPLYPDTIPWTIKGDSISLKNANATYAKMGARPKKGLDMDYLEVKDLNFGARDFYNQGSVVSVDIKNLSAKERCGLEIKDAHGKAMVNSQDIQLRDIALKTGNSSIEIDGKADMSLLGNDHTGSVKLTTNSSIGMKDLTYIDPSIAKNTRGISSSQPVKIKGKVEGNTRNLDLNDFSVDIPGQMNAKVSGNIKNVSQPDKLQAKVNVDANIKKTDFAKPFLDKDLTKKLNNLPPTKVRGTVGWNSKDLSIKNGYIDVQGQMKANVDGTITNVTQPSKMQANVNVDADIKKTDFAKPFLDKDLQKKLNFPPTKVRGTVGWNSKDLSIKNGRIDVQGQMKANVDGTIKNVTQPSKMQANVNVDADIKKVDFVKPFLDKDLQKKLDNIPPTKIKGNIGYNSKDLEIKNGHIDMQGSLKADIDGTIKNVTDPSKMQANVNLDTDVKNIDFIKPYLDKDLQKKLDVLPPTKLKGHFGWNNKDLDIKNGYIDMPGHVRASVDGNITNLTQPKKMQANIKFDADINDVEFAKKEFLDKDLQKKINIVPMKVKGNVKYNPDLIAGDVDLRLKSGGSLVGNGSYNLKNDSYTVDATATNLPVKKIVPDVDVRNASAHVKAKGHGFDFLGKNTAVDAHVQHADVDYAGKRYRILDGDVKLNGTYFDANIKAQNHGTLAANGHFDPKTQRYDIDADARSFPVNDFAPDLNIGNLTATVKASGEKFDFLKGGTKIDATVDLKSVVYNNQEFKDLTGDVYLDGNSYEAHINSSNPDCDVFADAYGTIDGDNYTIDLKGNVRELDLQALKVLDIPCDGQGNIDLQGDFNLKTKTYNANVQLSNLDWNYNGEKFFSDQTDLRFNTTNNSISAYYNEQSSHINFNAPHSVDYFLDKFKECAKIAQRQYKQMDLDVNEVCDVLPQFDLNVKMGPDGLIQRVLGKMDVDFRNVDITAGNDSTLKAHAYVTDLSVKDKAIDTLVLNIIEKDKLIGFNAHMSNRKGTWDDMAKVDVGGYAIGSQVNMLLRQENIKNEVGYNLGFNANLQDSILDLTIMPKQPIIAYRQWNINDDNYVRMDLGHKRLEGDITLESDSSLIALRTDPVQEEGKQNILATIKNVRIEEWTNMIPSLKDMSGVLDGDMTFSFDGRNLEGDGNLALSNFTYNGFKQGDLKVNTNMTIDPSTSSTHMTANIDIDGANVAVAYGSLNDSTASTPLNLALNLDRFPLRKVSAFIPGRMIMLAGYANGEMAVTGSLDNPIMNGYLIGDSAYVRLPRYGSSLRLGQDRINVVDNTIAFNNYKIYGLNDSPIDVNGNVDFTSLNDISMDLRLNGKNIQFIGSEQKPYSEIFGKGYIDIDGRLSINNNLTDINADAKLLSKSDITYVLQDEISTIANNSATKGMVTFVNPNDTAWYDNPIIIGAGASSSALNMEINADIEKGAKINAFLQPEGKDRVNINGEGKLKYSIDFAGKDNLSGSYIINSGTVRYTPPVISQKVFNIVEGSSITWNGDMLNPTLNLEGKHSVRTSVTNQDGNGSRLVDFDISAMIKNTLSNMDLKFDLQAKNDAIIESNLQTMTENQRSQAAINLLLYNSYSGTKTTGEFSTTGALFSFLQSQINSWAANNLKGIDVSFGINQFEGSYENGARTETSYSYRLSKSLFGDRFKIAVGGEYSTEASREQNFSQNLISDISFEYLLNPSGSRYLRLFRHKGIESVLEGEITVTGISFVMKHKVSSLGDLFKWLKKTPKLKLPDNITEPLTKQEPQPTPSQ